MLIKRHPHLNGNIEPNLSAEVLDRITCRLLEEYLRPDANTFLQDVAETKLQVPASQRPFGVTHLPFTKGVAKSISKGSQTAVVADENRQVSLVWRIAWAEPYSVLFCHKIAANCVGDWLFFKPYGWLGALVFVAVIWLWFAVFHRVGIRSEEMTSALQTGGTLLIACSALYVLYFLAKAHGPSDSAEVLNSVYRLIKFVEAKYPAAQTQWEKTTGMILLSLWCLWAVGFAVGGGMEPGHSHPILKVVRITLNFASTILPILLAMGIAVYVMTKRPRRP